MIAAAAAQRARTEQLGAELACWLRAVVAGAAEFPTVGLVRDPSAVRVEPRWEEADRLTLVVRVRPDEAGRVIGASGRVVDQILGPLVRRVGARLAVRVALEVITE